MSVFDSITASNFRREKIFTVLHFIIPVLIGIYIFFNPFPHTTAIKEFCFYISLLALLILIFFKKTDFSFRSSLTLPFVLFFLWAMFGLFFALDLTNSLHDLRAHFIKYVLIYYLLINYFNSQKRLEILSWTAISSATIFSLWAIIFYYVINGHPLSARLGESFLEIPTDYIGFVLVFAFTLAINKLFHHHSKPVLCLLIIIILILCTTTMLTQSRAALISLLSAIFILSFLNKKILIIIVALIILLITIPGFKERINTKEILQNERIRTNALTIEVIKSYPITGIGFGMQIYGNPNLVNPKIFDSRLPEKHQGGLGGGIYIGSPHNVFLDIAVRTGIIGLILFLSIILTALWMIWKRWRSAKSRYWKSWVVSIFAIFSSFMIAALFSDIAFGPQAVAFYTILAMVTLLFKIDPPLETEAI